MKAFGGVIRLITGEEGMFECALSGKPEQSRFQPHLAT